MNRSSLAAASLAFAALAIQPASAQIVNTVASMCHVVHAANLTHDRMLLTLTAMPSGRTVADAPKVGGGWVEACSTADIQLPSNLRCDLDIHVLAELKDASKVPIAVMNGNPAAAPDNSTVTGVAPYSTSDQPSRWFGIYYPSPGKAGWLQVPPGTKPPTGCPTSGPGAPLPPGLEVWFSNGTLASVGVNVTTPEGAAVTKACVAGSHSKTWRVPVSTTYSIAVTQYFDAACVNAASTPMVLSAKPVNGVVIVNFAAQYTLTQATQQ